MKRLFIGGLLVAALMLAGCSAQTSAEEPSQSREVYAMDTVMTLEAYGQNADAALDAAVAEIERLDALWSIASSDGEIAQLNAEKQITASADTLALLTRAKEISAATDGLFSTTIAPLMEAWGFTNGDYRVPDEAELSALLAHVDDEEIAISDSTVTIPADAKVDLGGNVQALGTKPDGSLWRVGLQDPADERALFATLELADKAVITSGAYERNFEQNGIVYHHIIDPRTGYPAESGLSSVTIVSDDGTLADGLSTALFIMGKEAAVEFWRSHRDDFDMVLLADDGAVTVSAGIADALTLSDGSAAEVVS